MPKFALKIQAVVVVVFILLIAMGGDTMTQFFNILVSMTNVAMTLPVSVYFKQPFYQI